MKTIIVYDDEIMNSIKSLPELELNTYKPKGGISNFGILTRYGMRVIDGRSERKEFIRYMWNRNKRIQKKWDKKYNDKFKIVKYTPSYIKTMSV